MNFRAVFHFLGILLIGLAVMMAGMVLVALAFSEAAQAMRFGVASIVTGFVAGAFMLGLRDDHDGMVTNRPEMILMLLAGWLFVPFFAGLPFLSAHLGLSMFEAWFESLSALTTTGISLIGQVGDAMPSSLYIWRALLGWVGGLCAVVMMVVFLGPAAMGGLNVAQMSFSHGEGEDILSRSRQTLRLIFPIYAGVTIVGWFGVLATGVHDVDGIVLVLGAISTSGITGPSGMTPFSDTAMVAVPVGLLSLFGAINMTHHVRLMGGRRNGYFKVYSDDPELGVILAWAVAATFVVTIALSRINHISWGEALHMAAFDAISFITTTGYGLSPHFLGEGDLPFPVPLMLGFTMVIGGSIASTASGIRPMRLIIMMMQGWRDLSRMVHERAVVRFRYRHQPVSTRTLRAISTLIVLYTASGVACSLGFALSGLTAEEAMIASLSALTNCGPALSLLTDGTMTGPQLNDGAQAIYALAMLLGRVEVLAFIALLTPQYWRK